MASAVQRYEPNTAVLRTQMFDQAGHGIEITDFCPRFYSRSRFFRPMTLIRRVRAIQGAPRIRISLKVRFDWGREEPAITRGSNHVRFVGEDMTLRLNTDAPITHVLDGQPFLLTRDYNFCWARTKPCTTALPTPHAFSSRKPLPTGFAGASACTCLWNGRTR